MKKKRVNKSALAREFHISRASIYYQPKMRLRDEILKDQILSVLNEHPAYGHKRIALHLGKNKKCILRVMKNNKILPLKRRSKRPFKGGDIGKKETAYKNWLKHLCPLYVGVFWASDFTYFWFCGRFYYLATIIDVFSREIVGIAFSPFHNKELVMEALKDALERYHPPKFIHSDQGSEYNSEAYLKLAESYGITISMSAKGKPWENGFQESFYSQFKLELGSLEEFLTLGEIVEAIYQQIHYYNNKRIHTSLRMPPALYATQHKFTPDKLF